MFKPPFSHRRRAHPRLLRSPVTDSMRPARIYFDIGGAKSSDELSTEQHEQCLPDWPSKNQVGTPEIVGDRPAAGAWFSRRLLHVINWSFVARVGEKWGSTSIEGAKLGTNGDAEGEAPILEFHALKGLLLIRACIEWSSTVRPSKTTRLPQHPQRIEATGSSSGPAPSFSRTTGISAWNRRCWGYAWWRQFLASQIFQFHACLHIILVTVVFFPVPVLYRFPNQCLPQCFQRISSNNDIIQNAKWCLLAEYTPSPFSKPRGKFIHAFVPFNSRMSRHPPQLHTHPSIKQPIRIRQKTIHHTFFRGEK